MKLLETGYSENYIQNRTDRFAEEFLAGEQSIDTIQQIMCTIHDYLLLCDDGESVELTQAIIQLRQSIFWVSSWNDDDMVDTEDID